MRDSPEKQFDPATALLTTADIEQPLSYEQLVDAAQVMTSANIEPDDNAQRALGLYMRRERERLLGNATFSGEPFPDRWGAFLDGLPELLQEGLLSRLGAELSDLENPQTSSHDADILRFVRGLVPSIRNISPHILLRRRETSREDRSRQDGIEKLGWRKRRVAQRLGKRAVALLEDGDNWFPVRGGVLGIKRTEHDPDIYQAVDESYIQPRGLNLEVHRDKGPRSHIIRLRDPDTRSSSISKNQVYPKVYWMY